MLIKSWSQSLQIESILTKSKTLTTKPVKSTALSLERVNDVHGGDGFATGVLGVGNGVSDDVFKEDFEDAACLLVNKTADAFNTATASQTADGWLCDPLDVIAEDLTVPFRSSFSQSFASLATPRHFCTTERL
ncbi:hypothetical protein QQP08_004519 [Theobroma cacao]|nr:hypothetical protein QQP08_004519 [Theobroma cacao]